MNYAKDITADYTASYAKYVATSRAIPSLVDGLKPVSRRCINSADDLKLYHDKKFLKVAKLEGQVMGDYHPHGGASMTILAQPFKTRYPLFEGQGNFGSPDEPNSVAASRYIETRLSKFCEDFYLSSADYADREDNYDGRLKEVVRYYPPIPGVLLTGSSGIAVGLSTNIPPHRVSDVCRSLLDYLHRPDSGDYIADMMPETCEEAIILTPKLDILKLYRTGEGSIQYKAKTHYETIEGKLALVVDAFPPDYNKKRLETSFILDAVESGKLELRNESSTDIRYVFLSTDKDILSAVEERLVSSSGYRMYIEHDGVIHLYTLSELYDEFIKSREQYIIRKYQDLIKKNDYELEYLRVVREFKKDKEYLRSMFDLSSKVVIDDIVRKYNTIPQIAQRIVSSSLSSMMKDNDEKLQKQYEELSSQNIDYHTYVEQPISKIVKDIKQLYLEYEHEERRAIHVDSINSCIDIPYQGNIIHTDPSSVFYIVSPNNTYSKVHAAELLEMDLSYKYVVASDFDYYVFYDDKGCVAVTNETMDRLESKFRSTYVKGVIGTDKLGDISFSIKYPKESNIKLGDWAIRQRLSYVKLLDEGDMSILEIAQS